MKTMQELNALKSRTFARAWHQDSRADFRESSKDFSRKDVSELDKREGAF